MLCLKSDKTCINDLVKHMRISQMLFVALLTGALLGGCSDNSDLASKIADLESKVNQLERENEELENEVYELKLQNEELESQFPGHDDDCS